MDRAIDDTKDHATPRLRRLAPALLLAAGLALAGCGGAGPDDESAEPAASRAEEVPADGADADATLERRTGLSFDATSAGRSTDVDEEPGSAAQPALIRTGSLTVESDDVARARFDLGKVVDSYRGTIADEKTTAGSEGDVRLSRVELRIPSDDFDAAMTDLAGLGKVTESTQKAQDVTGEVIDTRARIRAQEQSLARVEVLFSQAEDIRDIVAIETQLSHRQAELDSLKGQLAYLEDQAALSTITVYLEQAPDEPDPGTQGSDDNAFVGGLKAGWQALSAVGAGLATLAGALLPFAVVALLVGVPVAILLRRWLARHPLRRPATEA